MKIPRWVLRLVVGALLIATRSLAGPPPASWTYTWGVGTGGNSLRSLAADANGNLFLGGLDGDSGGVWLVKSVDANGNLRWSDNDGGALGNVNGVAVDPSGNVIAAGGLNGANWDWLIRKYSNSGALIWSVGYNDPGNNSDVIYAVAVDSAGSVYAGGLEYRPDLGQDQNWLIKKYDANGILQWTSSYNGTGNYQDGVNALTIDPSGNLIAAGFSDPTSVQTAIMLRKYDSNGNTLWSTVYSFDGGATSDNRGDAVTTDATGNIYLLGHWMPGSWPYYAWLIRKYDTNGNVLWTRTLYGGANLESRGEGITMLADGSVAVSGFMNYGTTGRDWMVADYDPTGTLLWTMTYDGTAHSNDEAMALTTDTCGNLFVGGFQGTAGGSIWRLQKYGTVVCSTATACSAAAPSRVDTYNGAASGDDGAQGVAVSPVDGSYAVAGYEAVAGQAHNLLVRKFAHDGTLQWSSSYNGPGNLNDEGRRVALDPSGNVVVVGRTDRSDLGQSWNMLALKYDAGGNLLWKREWDGGGTDDQAMSVAVDPTDGSIAVAGKYNASANPDWRIFKYDALGTTLWIASYAGPSGLYDVPYEVKIAPNGDVVAAGDEQSSSQSYNVVVRRYSSAGTFLWHYEYNDAGNGRDYDGTLAFDPAGNIFVAADSQQGFSDVDWLLLKLSSAGSLLWSTSVRPGPYDDLVWSVAVDGCGEPILVGADNLNGATTRWAVRKFDTSGNLVWTRTYTPLSGGSAQALCAAIDPSGSLFVTGFEDRSDLGQSYNWRTEVINPDACCGTPPAEPPVSVGATLAQSLGGTTPGSTVTWMITITNAGGQYLNGLTVVDTISPVVVVTGTSQPATLTPSSSSVVGGTRYVWTGAAAGLAPGASLTITVSGTIGSLCVATPTSNTACVVATNGSGTARARTVPVGFTGTAPVLSVAMAKSAATTGAIGDAVKYLLNVTNTGGATINSLIVVDTVSPVVINQTTDQPAGFTPTVVGAATGTRYVWSNAVANFLPGTTLTFTVTGNVGLVCVPTAVSNTGFASASNSCAITTGFSNGAGFFVAPYTSGMVVNKLQVPANPVIGGPVTYEIVVQNLGNTTIANVTVTDTVSPVITAPVVDQPAGIPAGVMLSVASGTRFVWSAPIGLPPQTSWTFTITGTMGTVCAPTTASNTAYVTGDYACSSTGMFTNDVAFTLAAPALTIAVSKMAVATGNIGDPAVFLTVVNNTGGATIDSLIVVDTVSPVVINQVTDQPAGFLVTATNQPGGTQYVWSGTSLGFLPGATLTFTLSGSVGMVCAPVAVSNSAFVSASNSCTNGTGFAGGAGFTVSPYTPGLTVTTLQTPASPVGGGAVTYQIVVANTGTATLQNVTLTDTVSPVVTSQAWDQPSGLIAPAVANVASGTRYVWSAGATPLLPGAAWTFTVTGTVGNVPSNRLVSNTAYAAGAVACGAVGQLSNPTAFLAQPIPTTSSLLVASATSTTAYGLGTVGQVVLTVTNAGTGGCVSVTPIVSVGGSGAVVILSSPATLGALGAGAAASFSWTFSCTGGGPVVFTCRAAATDSGNGAGITSAPATAACTVITPGLLACGLSFSPNPCAPGALGSIVLTINNPGGSAVTGVAPTLTVTGGAGLVAWPLGPTPAAVTIAPGGSQTFTWTYTAVGAGTASFAATAIGATPITGTAYGAAAGSVTLAAPVVPPPNDGLKPGGVKIVGGIRGYINPKLGEQSTILVKATGPGTISAKIFDRRGTLLRTLTTVASGNGTDVLHWDATDSSGAPVPAGIYPILVTGPGVSYTDKLAVLR